MKRTIVKECVCEEEQCQICFEYNETICQYYNHRTCFDCWTILVMEHIFQELGLDQLIFNPDFKFNKEADVHCKGRIQ